MKSITKKIATFGVLSAFVATTLGAPVLAETPPQNDRAERRVYQQRIEKITETKEKIIERREALRERTMEMKESYNEEKDKFLEARKRYKEAKEELSDEQKDAFEARTHAYLTKTVNTLIERLERIKNWAQEHNKLSDEQKSEIASDIDAQIDAIKTGVSDLEGATLEEMQAFATALRDRVVQYQSTVRNILAKAKTYQLESVWNRANSLAERLEAKVNEFEELGIDVEAARDSLAEAKEKLSTGKDKESIVSAYKSLREMATHLKQAIKQSKENS